MNRGKIYNIMIGAPSDITDDLFLNDKWPKETHSIFDLRNDNGKLRVYEGKREHYIELMNKVNHEKRDEIIRFLNMATEVPKDFKEINNIFEK